jgi:hypothetical protein
LCRTLLYYGRDNFSDEIEKRNFTLDHRFYFNKKFSTIEIVVYARFAKGETELPKTILVSDLVISNFSQTSQIDFIKKEKPYYVSNYDSSDNIETNYTFKFWPEKIPTKLKSFHIEYKLEVNDDIEKIEFDILF